MEFKRVITAALVALLSATSLLDVVEGNPFGYFRGVCDPVCKECKHKCESLYKAGTFKRWMCKGRCKFDKAK
ncbi:threonine ammonia-lyase [Babesia caballi]|uniref:Threonine ammonia-lyase n=1 Tax=Babesia caballi TaxID=5871 RepID=A0AAV4LNG7_BABCB|nr:threonine ammonia-lyase [Babesia caballi]